MTFLCQTLHAILISLDDSGDFTERSASGEAASTSGFCGIMGPGDIYVGVPSMDAVCQGLAANPNLRSHWGSKVSKLEVNFSNYVTLCPFACR